MHNFQYIYKRLVKGFKRYIRTIGFKYKHYHRSIKHRKRVWNTSPEHVRFVFFLALPIIVIMTLFEDQLRENILFLLFLQIYLLVVILAEFWYAGSDEYLKN